MSSNGSVSTSAVDAQVSWKRHGKQINGGGRIKRRRIGVNRRGVLRVRHSRSSDAGVYVCSTGSGGDEQSAEITVKFHSMEDALAAATARKISLDDQGSDVAAERIEVVSAGIAPFEHRRGASQSVGSYSVRYLKSALVS